MKRGRRKRGRRGPHRYGAGDRERLIAEQEQSGLSKIGFCKREGINPHTFYAWRKKSGRSGATFVEVEVHGRAGVDRSAEAEVVLTNGVRVMLRGNGEGLSELIRGVAGC